MKRTKISLYNTLCAIILQVANLIINLVLPKVMIMEYGSSVNGLVTSIRQFISYFGLVEAGLTGAAVYALYKPLANRDDAETNGILSAANRFYNISGFIFSGLVLLTAFLYPMFTSGQGINTLTIAILVLVIGTSGALEFFAVGKYKVLFTADQKSYVISLINMVAVVINAAIIVALALLHFDIVIVQLVALISFFARSALFSIYGRRKYPKMNLKAPPLNEALNKRWDSLILQILGVVTTATPIVVTSIVCGFKEASVFTIYNMVFASVLALLTTFNSGLSAIFGDILAKNEQTVLQRAYNQYEYLYYALLTWGYACAAILIMPFISVYMKGITDADYTRPMIALLFVVVGVLNNAKTPQGMLVISAGLYRETRTQTIIQASLNLGLSIGLAFPLGIEGVLLGAVVSNLYRVIDLAFFIPKTVTGLKPSITIRRLIRTAVLLLIAILPPLLLVDLQPANLAMWAVYAVPAAIWAFVVIAGGNLLMERQTAALVLERFSGMIKRKA